MFCSWPTVGIPFLCLSGKQLNCMQHVTHALSCCAALCASCLLKAWDHTNFAGRLPGNHAGFTCGIWQSFSKLYSSRMAHHDWCLGSYLAASEVFFGGTKRCLEASVKLSQLVWACIEMPIQGLTICRSSPILCCLQMYGVVLSSPQYQGQWDWAWQHHDRRPYSCS